MKTNLINKKQDKITYISIFSTILLLMLSLLLLLWTNLLSERYVIASSNYSVYFNGTTGSSIAFSVITNPSTNIGNGGFTIEFWIKPDSTFSAGANCSTGPDVFTNGAIIFDRDIFGPGDYGDFGLSLMNDNRIAFSIHNGSTGITVCSNPINLGQWNYVAAVKSGNTISIYVGVGGSLYSQSSTFSGNSNLSYNTGRSTSYSADPLISLGAEKHTAWGSETFTAYHYKGLMDELRISNVARSITSIPANTFSIDTNTVAMFRFENSHMSDITLNLLDPKGISYSTDTPNFSSSTPTNTPTNTPTDTPTPTPTDTPTPTPTTTDTPTPTPTHTDTPTPTPTHTNTPSPTPTHTDTPTPTPTHTNTPSPTPTPTDTASPTPTLTPTSSPTPTVNPSPTWTPTPSPTPIISPTPTNYPTNTPIQSPTNTPTRTLTPTPKPSPTNTPKPTNTTQRTNTPSPTPTSRLENTTLTPTQNIIKTTDPGDEINKSPSNTSTPKTGINQSTNVTSATDSNKKNTDQNQTDSDQDNNMLIPILAILGCVLALGIVISGIITVTKIRSQNI